MEKYLIYLLAGFCGGIIRGLVGFVKNKTIEKANHFQAQYFLITILISGIVGAAGRLRQRRINSAAALPLRLEKSSNLRIYRAL